VWVAEPAGERSGSVAPDWALPLLLSDELDPPRRARGTRR
jgi:hypothetical protein